MKQITNQELDCHTIEFFINRAKAMGSFGALFISDVIRPELEALQKDDPDVKTLLRTIDDYLRTVHIRELQALDGNKLTEATCRQRMREVLLAMEKERVIRWKYDYAWIYLTIMVTKELPLSYDSTDAFVNELNSFGIKLLPSRTTIEGKMKVVEGNDIEHWTFSDIVDAAEMERRRNIARVFLHRVMIFY